MRNLYFVGCVIAAVAFVCGCTKTNDIEIEQESAGVDFFAQIDNVNTKTSIDGLKVRWEKDDEIAIQVTRNHTENAATPKGYSTSLGIYRLTDDAAGTNVGKFTHNRGEEKITGDE